MVEPIQALYEAMNSQDAKAFDSFTADDIEYVDYALGETIRGKEAFKRYFQNWWTAFPNGTGKIVSTVESGDVAVVEAVGHGQQTGPFQTPQGQVPPSGQTFDLHFCHVVRIAGGKIVSGHSYSDAGRLLPQSARKAA